MKSSNNQRCSNHPKVLQIISYLKELRTTMNANGQATYPFLVNKTLFGQQGDRDNFLR